MKRLKLSENLAVGSLLFGLFFGAGNIIFPVQMGQLSGNNYLSATVGFLLTAIGLPILGVMSYAISGKENLREYSEPGGRFFSLFFPLALLLTIGPFFAIPRTATVAFEVGIRPFITENVEIYLFIYSVVFFAVALYFALKPNKILDVVGKVLTPLFLGLILILLFFTVFQPMGNTSMILPQEQYETIAFTKGIIDGYETMDALAGLVFAITIITSIKNIGITDTNQMAYETGKSSLYTIFFMSVLYLGLTFLGTTSRGIMPINENGGITISLVSNHYFGLFGQLLLAVTITVACLKTAIGLFVSISEPFTEMFQDKLSYLKWVFLLTLVSFTVANFGLNLIISLALPVLMLLYPLAITMIILWFIHAFLPLEDSAFKLTLIIVSIPAMFDFLFALPEMFIVSPIPFINQFAVEFIPFFTIGLGWIIPLLIALTISVILFRIKKAK